MKSRLHFIQILLLVLIGVFVDCSSVYASILRISANSATRQTVSEIEANYTTTHLFIDEVAGDSIPITIFFDPQALNIESCEIFTNLNRRDRADDDANSDGIEDGILPPDRNSIAAGDDTHYFKAHTMALITGGYQITLHANKTGAYRLTARYRFNGEPAGTYHYYNNDDGGGKRDHAVVVSPKTSRDIRLYEVNTLNIEASGTLFAQRSTFEDLSDRPGAIHTAGGRVNQWNLDYVTDLGINWLWFQPYHPYGEEGRHLSAANINARAPGANANTWVWNGGSPSWYEDVNYAFELGSPYAVRNFWEIDPRMSAVFSGDPTDQADLDDATNRANAMTAFRNFVADADTAGVNIMPDAAFNHTAWDVALGPAGVGTTRDGFAFDSRHWMAAQGASGWSENDLIHDRELRVFSRSDDYRHRANYYNSFFDNNIAPAPDRTGFGKWLDVCDIFFGRYAALVGAQDGSDSTNYLNEGDWIDYTASDWNGTSGGNFDGFTRATWRYFAQYAPYWLHQTRASGQNRNSLPSDGDAATRYAWDAAGIDGLRCDFGQGLPPQCWEFIINVARSHKWSFVFMAETLDGGAPPYRSNRHFDILNENILFAAKSAGSISDFRTMFEDRRNAFGQGLILLNTVSHDEDNYADPWIPVRNFAIFSTNDGAPMVFPGQELGISTSPDGTAPGGTRNFGYDLYEKNFGKYVPHFKTYNSMMPLWSDTDIGNDQLYKVYAAINQARASSPALRASNRWFFNGDGPNNDIWSVAKYEEANASPAVKDVVLAFANFDRNNDQSDNFHLDPLLAGLLGLQDSRTYNTKNIAAYENDAIGMTGRRDAWLWGSGITGANLKTGGSGFFVGLKKVPTLFTSANPADPAWNQNPFEAQYLKLYDVTAPTATPDKPAMPNVYPYAVGDSVIFDWSDVGADPGGVVPVYEVSVTVNGGAAGTFITGESEFTVTASEGDTVSISVKAVNPEVTGNAGPASESSETVELLAAAGDEDEDGRSNGDEDAAGTDPFDGSSFLRAVDVRQDGGDNLVDVESVAGRIYQLEWSADLSAESWTVVGPQVAAAGALTTLSDAGGASAGRRYYRVRVWRP